MARKYRNKGAPSIPAVPPGSDPATRLFLEKLKQALEVVIGHRGRDLDAGVTWRDLTEGEAGQAITNINGENLEPGTVYIPPTPFEDTTVTADTPAGLTMYSGLDFIGMEWTIPSTANVSHYEIWRNTVDNQGTAVLHGVTSAKVYIDVNVVENQPYYYWVRAVSYAGVPGLFNSVPGTLATLGFKSDTVVDHIPALGISDAKIGTLSAAKLFAVSGTIADVVIGSGHITNAMIGDTIQSDNYVPGVSGWIIKK